MDYDINAGMIYRWNKERKEDRPSFTGKGISRLTDAEKELQALRKQLKDVTEERDILKKVVSIFSRERSNKYEFIMQHKKRYSIEKMCSCLQILHTLRNSASKKTKSLHLIHRQYFGSLSDVRI